MRYSNITLLLFLQTTLLAQANIYCRLVIPLSNAAFKNPVLCHLLLCSIIQKTTLHIFVQSDHLNWYMQRHSLAEGEPLLSGEI